MEHLPEYKEPKICPSHGRLERAIAHKPCDYQFLEKSYNLQNSSNPSEEDWNIILSDNCKRYNVSLGDVMAVVSNIGNTFVDIETRRLLFFIKALYSIRLFQYSHEAVSQIEKTDEPGLKHNRLNGITNLQQLVGGRYFNLSGSLFLAPESSGRSRERGVLNGDSIRDLLNEIKGTYLKMQET